MPGLKQCPNYDSDKITSNRQIIKGLYGDTFPMVLMPDVAQVDAFCPDCHHIFKIISIELPSKEKMAGWAKSFLEKLGQ